MTNAAWPIKGVRVEGDTVIISVKGGNDAARWLCGELLAVPESRYEQLMDAAEQRAALYDGDDRQDIKTDVMNSFYAGVAFAKTLRAPVVSSVPKCTCCGTTENLHRDLGSGEPYRCSSPTCVVF